MPVHRCRSMHDTGGVRKLPVGCSPSLDLFIAFYLEQPPCARLASEQPLSARLASEQPVSARLASEQPLSARLAVGGGGPSPPLKPFSRVTPRCPLPCIRTNHCPQATPARSTLCLSNSKSTAVVVLVGVLSVLSLAASPADALQAASAWRRDAGVRNTIPEVEEAALATSFGTIVGVSTVTPGRGVAGHAHSDAPVRYWASGKSKLRVSAVWRKHQPQPQPPNQPQYQPRYQYQDEHQHQPQPQHGYSPALSSDSTSEKEDEEQEKVVPSDLQQQQQQLAAATTLRLSNIVLQKVEGQDRTEGGTVALESQHRRPSRHFNGVRELQRIQAALAGIGYSEFADFLNSKEARRFFKPVLHHHRITILAPSDYAMLPLPNDCEFGAADDERCRRDVIRRRRSQLAANLQWHVLMGQFVGQHKSKDADDGQDSEILPQRNSRQGADQGRCGQTIAEADIFVDKQVSVHGLDCILESQVIKFSDEPRTTLFE